MLTLRAENTFTDHNDNAQYVVHVFINNTAIWNGTVTHNRKNKAEGLLQAIADAIKTEDRRV